MVYLKDVEDKTTFRQSSKGYCLPIIKFGEIYVMVQKEELTRERENASREEHAFIHPKNMQLQMAKLFSKNDDAAVS